MPSSRRTLALLTRIRATDVVTDDLPAALAGPLGQLKSGLSGMDDKAFGALLVDQADKLRPAEPTERKRTVAEARAIGRDSVVVRQRRQEIMARKPAAKRFSPKAFTPVEQPT